MRIRPVLYTSLVFVLVGLIAMTLGMSGTEAQEPTGTSTPLCGVSMFTSDAAAQVAPDASITFFVSLSNCGGWRVLANGVVVAEVTDSSQMEVTVAAASIGIGAFQLSLDVLTAEGWVPSGFPGFDFAIDVAPEPPPLAEEAFAPNSWQGNEDAANGCTLTQFSVVVIVELGQKVLQGIATGDCLIKAIAAQEYVTGKVVAFVEGNEKPLQIWIKNGEIPEGTYNFCVFGHNGGGYMAADRICQVVQWVIIDDTPLLFTATPTPTYDPAPITPVQPEPLYQAPPPYPMGMTHFLILTQQTLEVFFENLQLFE